jgi:hydroxypyruvate reductase
MTTKNDPIFRQGIRANQRTISLVLSMALNSADPYALVSQLILLSNTKVCIGKNDDFGGRRIILIAMGKASLAMTQAAVDKLGERIVRGVCICKNLPAQSLDWKNIELAQGGHPVPDERSLKAGRLIQDCLQGVTAEDRVLVLISGGASALVCSPAEGLTLAEIQETNQLLLGSGATINEMNAVRKHLETLKGGGLLRAASPARVETLILSDVIGDDLSVIASGPTVADASTFRDAVEVLEKFDLVKRVPRAVLDHLLEGVNGKVQETVKQGDEPLIGAENQLIGSNALALKTAIAEAERQGLKSVCLSTKLTGEARTMGMWFAGESQKIAARTQGPLMVIAGGETTVTLQGKGKGGRNQELALAAVKQMAEDEKGVLVTLATDGEDGPTGAAGAIVTAETIKRAQTLGLDPEDFLRNNDAYTFFEKVNGLLVTGSTGTNVNDLTFYFRFA